jgi:Heavy metal associated domain 2
MTDAIVLHHVPGRMRLRVPTARGDAGMLDQIRQALMPLSGVRNIHTNPGIGTIVIEYVPTLHPQFAVALTRHAEERGALRIENAFSANLGTYESVIDKSIERVTDQINQRVQALTGNAVNLKEVFPFSILLYAIFFVDRAVNAAQWLSWAQFAFSSYMELHQEEPIAKVGLSIEALRAEMASIHSEGLEKLTSQIAVLQEAVRELSQQRR